MSTIRKIINLLSFIREALKDEAVTFDEIMEVIRLIVDIVKEDKGEEED